MPRPLSDAFSSLHFTLIKAPNNKYHAFCNVCKKTLCNTAAARLRAHRNRCRMEGQSPPPNHSAPSSLVIKTSNESSHDYTRNCDPLLDYPAEDGTQVESTNVYPSDTQNNYDDLDVDMRIVGVETKVETASKDECSAFGLYVATQLRKLDTKTCALVRFKICETLFNAEMGNLSKDSDT